MKDLSENNAIKFVNISKKKSGLFANFRVNGLRGGAAFSARISVDLATTELSASDPLEKIIEESAKIGLKEFKKSEFQFTGVSDI